MQQIIRTYLAGPRLYSEGVALYVRFGHNLRLKNYFRTTDPTAARDLLEEELRKLAGLTPAALAAMPRHAAGAAPAAAPAPDQRKPVTEEVRKIVGWRERFPFLSAPECPNVLKIAVADMLTAYGHLKDARTLLEGTPDATPAPEACAAVVESYLTDRALLAELEYYRDHGTLLGKALQPETAPTVADELAALSDVELYQKLRSATANVAKRKKAWETATADTLDAAAAKLAKWQARKADIEAEMERRKKK